MSTDRLGVEPGAMGVAFDDVNDALFGEPVSGHATEDLNHDFLWRYVKCLPERGRIGIFNRSYYEEVLVVRVHEELLKRQKLPYVSRQIWEERLADIAHFEDYLTRQGTIILKFFLHVSRKEQKDRFIERLDQPDKHWKFSAADIQEREFWGDYMHAFEEAIRATASKHAPWFVVPADHKWFTRLVVVAAIVKALERPRPRIPSSRPAEGEGVGDCTGSSCQAEINDMLRCRWPISTASAKSAMPLASIHPHDSGNRACLDRLQAAFQHSSTPVEQQAGSDCCHDSIRTWMEPSCSGDSYDHLIC
jgi:PPK2 family polyphosphate:nucleotide phosphotransferase